MWSDLCLIKNKNLLVLLFAPSGTKGPQPKTRLFAELVHLCDIHLVQDFVTKHGKPPVRVPSNPPDKFCYIFKPVLVIK